MRVRTAGDISLLSVRIERAAELSPDDLRAAVTAAYSGIGQTLQRLERTAIRLWNFMPEPTRALGDGLDRYMVFNQGRSEGYRSWTNRPDALGHLPTATAVGMPHDDLIVHCLASTEHGRPVENPRQIPAWRYSKRYGPTPPSFARATITAIEDRAVLLIGGTASVVGEDTAHVGDIARQLHETFENLGALIAAACGSDDRVGALDRLVDVRVHLTRPEDLTLVREELAGHCQRLRGAEFVMASLCRRDLLVEIEGVAELNRRA